MGWETSNRRSRLPSDWPKRRQQVLRRDGGRCTAVDHGQRCPEPATDVDHVTPGDNHDLTNLTSLCRWHHQQKTAGEAAAARTPPPSRRRQPEPHPGLRP